MTQKKKKKKSSCEYFCPVLSLTCILEVLPVGFPFNAMKLLPSLPATLVLDSSLNAKQRFQKCDYAKTKLFKTESRGWGLLSDGDIKVT